MSSHARACLVLVSCKLASRAHILLFHAGYGNTGPQACWAAAWLISVQIIFALLLESIVIGIVFA